MLFCIYLYDLGFPSTDTMRWKSKIKCCCCRCCLVSVVLHGCIFFRSYSSFCSTLLSLFSSLTLSFFRCLSSCSAAAAISFVVAALEEVSVLSSYLLHIVCEIFFLWFFSLSHGFATHFHFVYSFLVCSLPQLLKCSHDLWGRYGGL